MVEAGARSLRMVYHSPLSSEVVIKSGSTLERALELLKSRNENVVVVRGCRRGLGGRGEG